jgi:uncharacterized membrane protein YcaP (DUF421 family)
MFAILIRTLIVYLVLVISIRLTGKRQVGEMQLSELITAFLISEVAAAPLSDTDIPLVYAVLPILVLTCLEIAISFLTTKSPVIQRFFEPPPAILIARGKLNQHAMKKQRITLDEMLCAQRLKDIADLSQVDFCFLEHNGQLSAFVKGDGLTLSVVVDGKIRPHYLTALGRDEAWLRARLAADQRKLSRLFVMSTDGNTAYYIEKTKEN